MGHSSAFGFLAFALCLVFCVSASVAADGSEQTEAPTINKQQATEAVDKAKSKITEVFEKAQSEVDKAKPVLARLETFEEEAQNTKAMLAEAESKIEKEAKDNKDAINIVNNIKRISNHVITLFTTAKKNLNTADTSLTTALQTATTLKGKSHITIPDTETAEITYSTIANKASDLKIQAEDVDDSIISAIQTISGETSTADNIEKSLKDTKVANLHLSVIVAVAKIQTMMDETDSILRNTQNKKIESIGIAKEMQSLKTKASSDLLDSFDELIKSANSELRKVTDVVKDVEQALTKITKEKGFADDALTKVKAAEEVRNAEEEVKNAEACVVKVTNIVAELTSALETATVSVRRANVSKQEMVIALSKTTSTPSTEKDKETEKTNLPEGNDKGPATKDAIKQPTTTNTDQRTSKDLPNQSDNSAEEIKDALIKTVQNVPTTALTGKKAPAPGAKNDSAITVSVPLLVALIASAALQ